MQQRGKPQNSCSSRQSYTDMGADSHSEATHSLFAYPLESNFSGARYGLEPITRLQQHGVELLGQPGQPGQPGEHREHWHVFLDAAKACGSSPPDLRQASADFVVSISSLYDHTAHRCFGDAGEMTRVKVPSGMYQALTYTI